MNPATGEKTTHVGIPEGDPQVAALLAAGWVYLHTVEPGFPQRYKNIADPAVSPQPFPTLDIHHSSLGHTKARYDACLHENRRLNRLIEIVSLRLPVTPLQLKSGGLTWAFATNTIAELPGSRVLEISSGTVSLSNADKNAVRAALALEFPTGQIVLS